jgi:hypothetical protein
MPGPSGIVLQLRADWVVNIAQSRKHHTRAGRAVLLCALRRAAKVSLGPIFRSALSAVSSADPAPRSLGLQFAPQADLSEACRAVFEQ